MKSKELLEFMEGENMEKLEVRIASIVGDDCLLHTPVSEMSISCDVNGYFLILEPVEIKGDYEDKTYKETNNE